MNDYLRNLPRLEHGNTEAATATGHSKIDSDAPSQGLHQIREQSFFEALDTFINLRNGLHTRIYRQQQILAKRFPEKITIIKEEYFNQEHRRRFEHIDRLMRQWNITVEIILDFFQTQNVNYYFESVPIKIPTDERF